MGVMVAYGKGVKYLDPILCRDPWLARYCFFFLQLATQIENSFEAQKDAVFALKQKIESTYSNGDFLSVKSNTQCCHLNPSTLSQDFNFAVNVSVYVSVCVCVC